MHLWPSLSFILGQLNLIGWCNGCDTLCWLSIDCMLGSYKCRAGWAVDESPRLIFKNIVARPKAKKTAVCFYVSMLICSHWEQGWEVLRQILVSRRSRGTFLVTWSWSCNLMSWSWSCDPMSCSWSWPWENCLGLGLATWCLGLGHDLEKNVLVLRPNVLFLVLTLRKMSWSWCRP